MEREWTESGLRKSMNWRFIEVICFLFIWDHITVQSSRQDPSATEQHVAKQYDWLISDRGPFHHSRSYLSFVDIFHGGFTTRYKIYRWVLFLYLPLHFAKSTILLTGFYFCFGVLFFLFQRNPQYSRKITIFWNATVSYNAFSSIMPAFIT